MIPSQCRMARAALQIEFGICELAKVAPSTIARFEAGEELKERTIEALRAALEKAGVSSSLRMVAALVCAKRPQRA